jgi:DNA-binding transcriptional LysR family regulator
VDILHLRYFSSVYETLNFSHSAERLYISRQALRQAIRSIEVELCQPLFVNRSNKLWATRAADTLYQESCEVLRAYRNLENSVEVLKTQSVITANCGLVTNQADCYTDEELEWLSSYDMTRGGGGK